MTYKKRQRRRRRRQAVAAAVMIVLVLLIGAGAAGGFYLWDQSRDYIGAYEKSSYNKALYQGELFAQDLCVTSGEVSLSGFQPDSSLHAAVCLTWERSRSLMDTSYLTSFIRPVPQRQ